MYERNWRILKHFMQRDLIILKKTYKGILKNSVVWPVLTAIVFGYVIPTLGVGKDYGAFVVIGAVVAVNFYTCFMEMFFMVQDFEGPRTIDFELCLPTTPTLLIAKFASTFSFRCLPRTLPLPFIGKLLLYNRFSFEHFSFFKFVLIFLLINLMFSLFMLMFAGILKGQSIYDFRVQVIDPMFFLGCYMFPWKTLHKVMPIAAYVDLLNPLTYAMEGSRIAFLGQHGLLNFWICCGALAGFSVVCFFLTTVFLRRRLDYVVPNKGF